MAFENVPDFTGRSRLALHRPGDLAIGESVEPLSGGENVGVIHEAAATGVRSVPALCLRERHLVGFHVTRERENPPAPVNARANAEHGELPVSEGNRLFHLPSPRWEFCWLTFAKSDNAGGASGPRLPRLDLHPSKRLGLVDLHGEDGKAAGELAGGLRSALAVEYTSETVEAFAREFHSRFYHKAREIESNHVSPISWGRSQAR